MASEIRRRICTATLSIAALILVGWLPALRAQSVPIVSITCGQNADGRLELFVVGSDHTPYDLCRKSRMANGMVRGLASAGLG